MISIDSANILRFFQKTARLDSNSFKHPHGKHFDRSTIKKTESQTQTKRKTSLTHQSQTRNLPHCKSKTALHHIL